MMTSCDWRQREQAIHAGIVYKTQERAIGETIRVLMLIHEVLTAEERPIAWSICEPSSD